MAHSIERTTEIKWLIEYVSDKIYQQDDLWLVERKKIALFFKYTTEQLLAFRDEDAKLWKIPGGETYWNRQPQSKDDYVIATPYSFLEVEGFEDFDGFEADDEWPLEIVLYK